MEATEGIIIVGAGLAGLAVAVGLHRLGLRSLVLESSDTLRASGFAITQWANAWRALDELGVGDSLREQHVRIEGLIFASASSGSVISKVAMKEQKKRGDDELRCVWRSLLLEALAKQLPEGSIRYSSKLVAIEEAGKSKLLHLADGSTLKAKVLIGCDGIKSIVSKWLGLKEPTLSGRYSARGFMESPGGHGIKPEFAQYFGEGWKIGILPCDDRRVFWFFTWTSHEYGQAALPREASPCSPVPMASNRSLCSTLGRDIEQELCRVMIRACILGSSHGLRMEKTRKGAKILLR